MHESGQRLEVNAIPAVLFFLLDYKSLDFIHCVVVLVTTVIVIISPVTFRHKFFHSQVHRRLHKGR